MDSLDNELPSNWFFEASEKIETLISTINYKYQYSN